MFLDFNSFIFYNIVIVLFSTCFQSTRLVVYLALVLVLTSIHKMSILNFSFLKKNLKNYHKFWENFTENEIFGKYRTSYQPIKASVFKFLFVLSSLSILSFLTKIVYSTLIHFDWFETISFFLAKMRMNEIYQPEKPNFWF